MTRRTRTHHGPCVLDVNGVYSTAHAAPWQTMGWEALLVYEMHARRFTDISPGTLSPLDIVADELEAGLPAGRARLPPRPTRHGARAPARPRVQVDRVVGL